MSQAGSPTFMPRGVGTASGPLAGRQADRCGGRFRARRSARSAGPPSAETDGRVGDGPGRRRSRPQLRASWVASSWTVSAKRRPRPRGAYADAHPWASSATYTCRVFPPSPCPSANAGRVPVAGGMGRPAHLANARCSWPPSRGTEDGREGAAAAPRHRSPAGTPPQRWERPSSPNPPTYLGRGRRCPSFCSEVRTARKA